MKTYEYQADGKTVVLHCEEHLAAVRFKEPAKHSVRHATARSAGIARFENRLEVPNEKYTILDLRELQAPRPAAAEPTRADAQETLATSPEVDRVAPVFRYGNSRVIATDRVLVGLKSGTPPQPIAAEVDGTVVESDGDEHVIRLRESSDPLDAARTLSKRPDVEYAEPDFVNVVPKLARKSSSQRPGRLDAFDSQQYAIHITHAVQAWDRVRGGKGIKIAILDEGVDTTHEDLAAALVGSFDAADRDTFQEPNPWDGHGTACSGLAAAIHNDVGVRGIGAGCSLLAVRIAYSEKPNGDWIITNSGTARAIDWSWRNGADVLSNSWGGGAPSTKVTRAFGRARERGRGGKGCVIVVAAGNEASHVSYPANLPNVVCVAASNEFDEPKTKTSHDGERWWGSNFGPEVTIAAPGVHNYTTDIAGTGGYNRGPRDPNYIPDFNGTSSATPIVAGAVGLILSANPRLTEKEVRQILVESAEKVGAVKYDEKGHHPRMGYGRLNVLVAVEKALAMR